MIDELPKDPASLFGAALTGLVMGGLWLRSKLSRDSVQIANDQAEIGMLENYRKENGELRASLSEVTQERNKLYREVGEMAGSVRALEQRCKMLEETLAELRNDIRRRMPTGA